MKIHIFIYFLFFILYILRNEAALYVQMTPYANEDCTHSYGVGYSFLVGECYGVGDNFVGASNLKVQVNGSEITFSNYGNYDTACATYNPNLDVTYNVGGCYRTPKYGDGYFQASNFVHVSLAENPNIPTYGYRNSWYADHQCVSNTQWYYFYTNNTVFVDGADSYYIFYCLENEPMGYLCNKTSDTCTGGGLGYSCVHDWYNAHEHNYYSVSC